VGKTVILKTKDQAFDWLASKLPDQVQATTPEEVETVFSLDCRTSAVGSYINGAKARDHVCKMVVYDMGTGRVVYTNSVVGCASDSISPGQSGTSARPDEKVL
jgi:hypothetical protein